MTLHIYVVCIVCPIHTWMEATTSSFTQRTPLPLWPPPRKAGDASNAPRYPSPGVVAVWGTPTLCCQQASMNRYLAYVVYGSVFDTLVNMTVWPGIISPSCQHHPYNCCTGLFARCTPHPADARPLICKVRTARERVDLLRRQAVQEHVRGELHPVVGMHLRRQRGSALAWFRGGLIIIIRRRKQKQQYQ